MNQKDKKDLARGASAAGGCIAGTKVGLLAAAPLAVIPIVGPFLALAAPFAAGYGGAYVGAGSDGKNPGGSLLGLACRLFSGVPQVPRP